MRPDFSIFRVNPGRTPAQLRREGFLIVPLGLFVVGGGLGMLALAFGWRPPAEWLPAGTRIEPRTTPWETPIGAALFLSGVVFTGLVAVAEGVWRILLGRMNPTLLRIMLVMLGIFFVAGAIASMLLGRLYGQVGQ